MSIKAVQRINQFKGDDIFYMKELLIPITDSTIITDYTPSSNNIDQEL